ncbi:non-ribosomal peptide synthetase, partial [Streptomyces sp. SID8499]|nr:non-ribosomal peptide synthetase [Streptomyces sp. SID8499]
MPSITSQYLDRYRRLTAGDGTGALLPVTGAQRRFVLVRSLDPSGRPDLVPMFFAFPHGTVDPARLRAAARRLAARHTALRSRPTVVRGTPVL